MPLQTSTFQEPVIASGFRDSAFGKNKDLPLHRWVPWIAGFSAEFVDDCLSRYLPTERPNKKWVFDPFAGVGTTLVQAYSRGFNVVGFEINPYAALAARLKLEATRISRRRLAKELIRFRGFMSRRCSLGGDSKGPPRSRPPIGFDGRTRLFHPRVERKVLYALDFIGSIEEARIRDLFRLALGSVMVSASNYSYEPSLTRRSAVGKPAITNADVGHLVSAKLSAMLEDVVWVQKHMRSLSRIPQFEVISASIFQAQDFIPGREFADLAVTSPPYLNNYHYPRNTRPQLHWLGFTSGPGYNGARELDSFGKFWQTVRALPPVRLDFRLPALERVIDTIRHRNTEEGPYGGRGWANYVATYFNDTRRFCEILARFLRPGGRAIIVRGNSIIQGVEVKTDDFFGQVAQLCGLEFEDTVLLRKKRTGNSIIQSTVRVDKAGAQTILYEAAVILRK